MRRFSKTGDAAIQVPAKAIQVPIMFTQRLCTCSRTYLRKLADGSDLSDPPAHARARNKKSSCDVIACKRHRPSMMFLKTVCEGIQTKLKVGPTFPARDTSGSLASGSWQQKF